jgi:hypothetical protein
MSLPAGATNAVAVTPSDTVAVRTVEGVAQPFAGIYVGATGGNVTIRTVGNQTILFAGTVVGSTIWLRGTHVHATGTAATSLVAMY